MVTFSVDNNIDCVVLNSPNGGLRFDVKGKKALIFWFQTRAGVR